MPEKTVNAGLRVASGLQAGNLNSDMCYLNRNAWSMSCGLMGWPQNSSEYGYCIGNNNEIRLKNCLNTSHEPNWWKDFEGCTSADQCIATAGEIKYVEDV